MENHQIYGFACTIKYNSVGVVVVVAFRLISLLDFHAIIRASNCSIVSPARQWLIAVDGCSSHIMKVAGSALPIVCEYLLC